MKGRLYTQEEFDTEVAMQVAIDLLVEFKLIKDAMASVKVPPGLTPLKSEHFKKGAMAVITAINEVIDPPLTKKVAKQ